MSFSYRLITEFGKEGTGKENFFDSLGVWKRNKQLRETRIGEIFRYFLCFDRKSCIQQSSSNKINW